MEVAIVFMFLIASIFGIFYLHFSTRNKERLALIEKGADASIFMLADKRKSAPFAKVFILNFALLLMGVGLGIFIGELLSTSLSLNEDVAFPASILLTAGGALFVGFNMTKKLEKE
ncbi:MAG: hypothetical protein JKZ00_02990 [Flavobacteriaceae bacterium]|nr:hypothetical protein [Flavobacteriaceae bacterium]